MVKVKGKSVQNLEWNERTDRQTNGGDCITPRANAVAIYKKREVW